MMSSDPWQHQTCTSCTVPAATTTLDPSTGLCQFCADPPPPLDVPVLLAEADQHLNDGLDEIITARMGHASTAFPIGGWSVYVTEVDGTRITVTATRRDPQTREVTNREFTAVIAEVK